jgi:hypothetical protein
VRWRPSGQGVEYADWTLAWEAGFAGFALVVVGLLILIFLPYVFFGLELLVLPLFIAYRIARGKPWTVEARSGSERRRWQVHGWRNAGDAAGLIAQALARGEPPGSLLPRKVA